MWLFFSLAASILWGLTYALNERVYKDISIVTSLGITTLLTALTFLSIGIMMGWLQNDVQTILHSRNLQVLIITQTITLILAEVFIAFSISAKNATLAGLIEISYPLFIALFSFLLFHEKHFNAGIAMGAALIALGILAVWHWGK